MKKIPTFLWGLLLFLGWHTTLSASGEAACNVRIEVVKLRTGQVGLVAHSRGEAPFVYEWSNGDSLQRIVVDPMGEYCVKVTDASGCEAESCVDFGRHSGGCQVEIIKKKVNDSTYALFAQIRSSADSIYLEWSTGETVNPIMVTDQGEYCVHIRTADGCADKACTEVEFEKDTACDVEIVKRKINDSTYALVAQVRSKTRDQVYYLWSTGDTTNAIQVNAAGKYCVKIKSLSGCTAEDCIEVEMDTTRDCVTKIQVVYSVTGQVDLIAHSRGVAPFDYEWSTGDSTQMISVTSGGKYCVEVTDSSGCQSRACVEVRLATPDRCRAVIRTSRDSNGVWTLTAVGGGQAPFTYQWSTGDSTQSITVDTAGEYCVKVTDSLGCEAKTCIRIPNRIDHKCAVTIKPRRTNDSTMVLTAHQRGGQGPLTYQWSTGDTTQSIVISSPGKYCVTVTDVLGCESESCFDLKGRKADTCAVRIQMKRVDRRGKVILQAHGYGNGRVTYEWSTGETRSSIIVDSAGTYCVTITASDGCQARACVDVPQLTGGGPSAIKVYPNPFDDVLYVEWQSDREQRVEYQLTNQIGNVLLKGEWSEKGDVIKRINTSNVKAGIYSLVLTTANGTESRTIVKR